MSDASGDTSNVKARRWTWAQVDLGAIEHNIELMRQVAAPAEVWAVVKADGYGHGAVRVARAAQRAGATGLCVALVHEGLELRSAGVTGPILVLTEQPPEQLDAAVAGALTLTVSTAAGIAAVGRVAQGRPVDVHLKVDTGMRRSGCDPAEALGLARLLGERGLQLAGVFSHLAMADVPDDPFNVHQLALFDRVLADLDAAGIDPGLVHTANSAGALAHPAARRHLVRVGIAAYGISPGPEMDALAAPLRPALSWRSRVSVLRPVAAGDRISYGLRHRFDTDTVVAVAPVGYADGVARRAFECGVEVLVGGRRRPIVGVVTMDQVMIDVGAGFDVAPVSVGDEVVLIGVQGDGPTAERVTAAEWADRLGTIGYEIVCAISARVPRLATPNGGAAVS
jgi:alanine racemase